MKKIVLLSIALTVAGFLSVTAQNNVPIPKQLQRQNASFEYPDYKTPKLPGIEKSNSGQDWWEPDTVYIFREYEMVNRYIYKYNSHGLLTEDNNQYWENNSWKNDGSNIYTYTYDSNNNVLTKLIGNSSLLVYSYDSNNNMLTELRQNWQNNSWVNISQTSYTYDSNNNLLTNLQQNWQNDSWVNISLTTYTYDSNNNKLSDLSQNWQNNSWVNNNLYTFTYDVNRNLLTELFQTGSNNSWKDFSLHTYTYDSNNSMLTELLQMRENDSWRNGNLRTFTYDSNNNLLTDLYHSWSNDSWQSFLLFTYTYDSYNNMLSWLRQYLVNDSWQNYTQCLMTYDENGNGASAEYWWWGEESWQPVDDTIGFMKLYYNNMQSYFAWGGYKMTASYVKVSDFTAIKEPPATPELNAISIYPNPTAGKSRISNLKLRIKDIQIFNVTGNKIPLSVEKAGDEIDISHLPAGTYFVQVTTEKGIVTKKIVKL